MIAPATRLVALLADRPALQLRQTVVGTVVHVYGRSDLYEVEFINANGDTVGVEMLNVNEVRAVDPGRAMLHYNVGDYKFCGILL